MPVTSLWTCFEIKMHQIDRITNLELYNFLIILNYILKVIESTNCPPYLFLKITFADFT